MEHVFSFLKPTSSFAEVYIEHVCCSGGTRFCSRLGPLSSVETTHYTSTLIVCVHYIV